ncbi:dNTP triphosphohydrolase [Enterobacter quasiroggenkampii]|uniref:deoxyguanosinetriphosphate triphosphohydrolase family protein n=1 Tax=Enterobacter quasiroggenkampii TaxID=2497436 RepID=UPI0021CF1BA8|nr:dNTP triphosphohydrolase [Enterobacter quasiroggenkampii]MCU6388039.1 dNTP triphosphohydrolase [Enterobacter quasiroggenkampii]
MQWDKLLYNGRRKDKDKGNLQSASSAKPSDSENIEWRQEIERDFDRILFAAPTRRLADKTQVFPLDMNDSVRTRLTHSHEVANFARGIGMRLAFDMKNEVFEGLSETICVERDIPALLAAIGLAHDLGNPPFGHQGEAAMRNWFNANLSDFFNEDNDIDNKDIFNDFFQFDGNSQTLRLVTKLQILNDQYGLNLTYATLAALIKYPRSSYTDSPGQWEKHGFFHSESKIVNEIWLVTGLKENIRHPFTWIMEACDDIAYSVLDAEDTVKKGLASYKDLIDHLKCWEEGKDPVINKVVMQTEEKNAEYKHLQHELTPSEINDMHMQMFRVKATIALVNDVVDTFVANLSTLLSHHCEFKDLIGQSQSKSFCKALKAFDKKHGYRHRSVLELELKGSNYIQKLMDMLWIGIHGHKTQKERDQEKELQKENDAFKPRMEYRSNSPFGRYAYGRISENYRRIFEDEKNGLPVLYKEAQLLADAISGMTDSYLIRLHDELKSLYEYESCSHSSKPTA